MEPDADFLKRREEFLQRYKSLIDELQVDFISVPQFVPNDRGSWEVVLSAQIMDRKNQPVPSPITITP